MTLRRLWLLQAILLGCLALGTQARSILKVADEVPVSAQPDALEAHVTTQSHWQARERSSSQRSLQGLTSNSLASGIAQGTISTGGEGGGKAQLNYNPGAGRRLQRHAAHATLVSSAPALKQAAQGLPAPAHAS